ncbi:hypothetical protein RRG08_012523 [Elysia crispata]|uniref:Uncharacterized protein n=1 Tax=Elysia crispata TaxID=231223 RepID=A0AAE1E1X7_9GAST|nr:hypothetical protein RRG08_012523 [Elysia crispata]
MLINEPECEPDPNFVDVDISYNNEIKSKDVDDIMISTTSRRLTITTAHCDVLGSYHRQTIILPDISDNSRQQKSHYFYRCQDCAKS